MSISMMDFLNSEGIPKASEDLASLGSPGAVSLNKYDSGVIVLSDITNSAPPPDVRYRISRDHIKDGSFEDAWSGTALSSSYWTEYGTTGAVTRVASISGPGSYSAQISSASASTRLKQVFNAEGNAKRIKPATDYLLGWDHIESNALNSFEWALWTSVGADIYHWKPATPDWVVAASAVDPEADANWTAVAGSATLVRTVISLPSYDTESGDYTLVFRPAGAAAETITIDHVFFCQQAQADDPTVMVGEKVRVPVTRDHNRVAVIGASVSINIASY